MIHITVTLFTLFRFRFQYWALKTELDRLDGGEDDSDVVQSWVDDQVPDSGLDSSGLDGNLDMDWDDNLS